MAQITVPVFSLVILFTVGLFINEATAYYCCTKYSSTHVPIEKVKGYYIQDTTGRCTIDAIVLRTVRGKWICADPKKHWVIEIAKILGKKVSELGKRNIYQ